MNVAFTSVFLGLQAFSHVPLVVTAQDLATGHGAGHRRPAAGPEEHAVFRQEEGR